MGARVAVRRLLRHDGCMEKREASELSKRVAEQLRIDQARRGWTAKHVARTTGIHYNSINRMLNGQTEINVRELFLITEAIGTDAHTILTATEEAMPEGHVREMLVSEAPSNVTHIRKNGDWDSVLESDEDVAAHVDPEADEDEPGPA